MAFFICRTRIGLLVMLLAAAGLVRAAAPASEALPFISPVFGDNMVLQRDAPDRVWGWAAPGTRVLVKLGAKHATGKADAGGKWMVQLPAQKAGGPFTMTVTASGPATATLPAPVTFTNIMEGDVWICSGQSNMEFGIGNINNAGAEIAAANEPDIRLYMVPHSIALTPQASFAVQGRPAHTAVWSACSPTTVAQAGWGGFSAVGYYFGRHLQHELHVAIGLIQCPWGGTPAEAFISHETLLTVPSYQDDAVRMVDAADSVKFEQLYADAVNKWYAVNDPHNLLAPADYPDADWPTLTAPGAIQQAGIPALKQFSGLLYLRRTFEVPARWAGQDAILHLGVMGDSDTVFLNGEPVGATIGGKIPKLSRTYTVPGRLLKAGKNVIAVRLLNEWGDGGFNGKPSDLSLVPVKADTAEKPVSLAGVWKYRIFGVINQLTVTPDYIHTDWPNAPSELYNSLINPLVPLRIKGAIWYQGEANASRAYFYRELMPAVITDWRKQFNSGAFPFLLVQLAGWQPNEIDDDNTYWAELREAQLLTVQHVPQTGMAVAIDIGDKFDIHPKDKQDVGDRLALNALALAYGRKLEYSGPIYASMKVEENKIRLSFTHANGLAAHGGELTGFMIAESDQPDPNSPHHAPGYAKFVPAHARIDGNTVLVWADNIAHPLAVRYAYLGFPSANLYNAANLPASPFRTDNWPEQTRPPLTPSVP